MKRKLINGWTKETVMAQVKKYNNGRRSSDGLICFYENEDTNRCAIGCFIPDGHPGLECGYDVIGLLGTYPELRNYIPFGEHDILDFQMSHDKADENFGGDVYAAIENFLQDCE